jgi:hypothetical protein
MTWDNVAFSGIAGGIIGTLGAFGAALFVIKKQGRDARNLEVDRQKQAAAIRIVELLADGLSTLANAGSDAQKVAVFWKMTPILTIAQAIGYSVSDNLWNAIDLSSAADALKEPPERTPEDIARTYDLLNKMMVQMLERAYEHLRAIQPQKIGDAS